MYTGGENMSYKKLGYPAWKRAMWRGLRTFVSAFFISGSAILIAAKQTAFVSWENFLETLLFPFVIAGLAGGTNAFGKYIRETFGSADQKSTIDKIPF